MPTKLTAVVLLISILPAWISCKNTGRDIEILNDSSGRSVALRLSPNDAIKAGLMLDFPSERETDKTITCTGTLALIRDGISIVSTPAAGIVRMLNVSAGNFVEQGSVLAGLESIEFIRLQQEFLEAENQIAFYREDYKRQGELTVENATSVRKMQAAQRDFQSFELKLNALRLQLQVYGIHADSLKPDQLTSTFLLRAPFSGVISRVNATPGSYAEQGEEMFVMVKDQRLFLKLAVPEDVLPMLKNGQVIDFFLPQDSLTTYQAVLKNLTNPVDPIRRTSEIYAGLSVRHDRFHPGMTVRSRLKTRSRSLYIPKGAIVHDAGLDYLFVKREGLYEKIPVLTGTSQGEWSEVIGFPRVNKEDSIVVEGGQALNSMLQQH